MANISSLGRFSFNATTFQNKEITEFLLISDLDNVIPPYVNSIVPIQPISSYIVNENSILNINDYAIINTNNLILTLPNENVFNGNIVNIFCANSINNTLINTVDNILINQTSNELHIDVSNTFVKLIYFTDLSSWFIV